MKKKTELSEKNVTEQHGYEKQSCQKRRDVAAAACVRKAELSETT